MMISITRLTLENFQSHKYSVLNFKEGLNSIVGPTDSGKTAIFRALKWALYNEPSGDYFLRTGENYVSVKVEFSNGHSIRRYRKGAKNYYEVIDDKGNSQEFSGFSKTIPEEVINASQVMKMNLTPTEGRLINMAEQLEPPFLLSDTGSIRATAIGKLIGSDVIDTARKGAVNDLNIRRREKDNAERDLSLLDEQLKGFDYLEELEKTINSLEEIQFQVKEKKRNLEELESIFNKYEQLKGDLTSINKTIESLNVIEEVRSKYNQISSIGTRLNHLLQRSNSLNTYRNNIDILEKNLEGLDGINDAFPLINELQERTAKIDRLMSLNNQYKNVSESKSKAQLVNEGLKNLPILSEKITRLDSLIKEETILNSKLAELMDAKNRIRTGTEYLTAFKELDKVRQNRDIISEKMQQLEVLRNRADALGRNSKEISENDIELKKAKSFYDKTYNSYLELYRSLDICPTCFRPIDKNDEEELLKHIGEVHR